MRFPTLCLLGSVAALGCSQEWVSTPSNPLPVLDAEEQVKGSGSGGAGGAGAGGSSSSSGGGTNTGACVPEAGAAEVVKVGTPGKLLLVGCVVTPDGPIPGSVLIQSDTLICVGASCETDPNAGDATVVRTHGVIMPGMIDTHNHILFNMFDESDWSPSKPYSNHQQWPNEARYGALVDAKQYLNGEGTPNLDPGFGCEMNKYGEMKGLIAGTTSIVGAANPVNKSCYGSVARTIDQTANDLEADKVQVSTLFPPSTGDAICANIAEDKTDAFVVHCGEGVDATALAQFDKLATITTTPGCLHAPETTIVHGTAFGEPEFAKMADRGMNLVWSPQSNVFLYGSGTDYTKTTDVKMAIEMGINVALAPDWSLGGSQNLLDELRFADKVDKNRWNDELLSPEKLVQMVTINAAKALSLDGMIGSLEVGKKADVTVISGDVTKPFDAILAATPRDVSLVVVNGVALYGDAALVEASPTPQACEALDICTAAKFACVVEPNGTATNKLGQTWDEITTTLTTELEKYDAMDYSEWNFAPLAPIVKCP